MKVVTSYNFRFEQGTPTPIERKTNPAYHRLNRSPKNEDKNLPVPLSSSFVCVRSYGRIASPRTRSLDSVHDPSCPVFEQVGDVPYGVSMGQQVPASSAVSVVVEPRSEDQVGRSTQEDAVIQDQHVDPQ